MNNKVHQLLMNQVINLFGWDHIRTIEIQHSKQSVIEIIRLEPTMVPAFLLDIDKVRINSQVVLINKIEEVILVSYFNMNSSIIGYVVLYKGDIAYECKRIRE